MRMQIVGGKLSRRPLTILIVVSAASAFALSLVAVMHLLSPMMAVGIWSVLTLAVGALLRYQQADTQFSSVAHRRFILIYAVCGVFAASRALIAGWTRDDTVGLSIYISVLILGVVLYTQKRKTAA